MKLYLNEASPYARLIRVLLMETGLDRITELVFVDPWKTAEALIAANPASKVPALTLEDGTHLVESTCIGDFLIWRSGMKSLSPTASADPACAFRILGLGRAAIDCSFGAVIQQRFAPGSPLIRRWLDAVPRIADALEEIYRAQPDNRLDLAGLTVAVAFEYVAFRLPQIDWRTRAPHLAAEVATVGARPSMANTRPA